MRKAFVLCPVLLLAALMSGCAITIIPTTMLRVTRDIAAGEVIREGDLKTVPFGKRLDHYHDDWGWADAGDRPKVIGHRSRIAMDKGWPFHMSEIER